MKSLLAKALLLVCFMLASPAAAAPGDELLAQKFGSRGWVLNVSLAPSGKKMAFIAPAAPGEDVVYVVDLDGDMKPKPIFVMREPHGHLLWCVWASDENMVCYLRATKELGGVMVGFSRLYVVASDGIRGGKLLTPDAGMNYGPQQFGGGLLALDMDGNPNQVLMTRYFGYQFATAATARKNAGLGVELVDLTTLKRKTVALQKEVALGYVADEKGELRILVVAPRDRRGPASKIEPEFSYRPLGEAQYKSLKPDVEMKEFDPVSVDSKANVVIAYGVMDGFRSLFSVALDGTGRTRKLLSADGVDIDGALAIGRDRKVVGATFATDRRTFEYFDPEIKSISDKLQRALPGNPLVEIADSSADGQRMLVVVLGDTNPGMVYLYDKPTNRLSEIITIRGELEGMTLSHVKAVTYPARDGTQIPAYLTLPPGSDGKNLPALVMPHGGPSSRDEWGFDWLAQYFAQKGYAVLQPNYRGSAGYGKTWELDNGFKGWKQAMSDINDGGKWLEEQGITNPAKLAIFGWSYGGYAALRSAEVEPGLYKAVVAIAPVTDLAQMMEEGRNFSNFWALEDYLGGGKNIEGASPARHAEDMAAPVLLVQGEYDENVPFKQSLIMKNALENAHKPVQFIDFPDLGHSLEDAAARAKMLSESDAFLRKAMDLPAK